MDMSLAWDVSISSGLDDCEFEFFSIKEFASSCQPGEIVPNVRVVFLSGEVINGIGRYGDEGKILTYLFSNLNSLCYRRFHSSIFL